jgi:hypothetical protein
MINLYYVGRFSIRQKRIDKFLELSDFFESTNCDYNFKIFADVDLDSNEFKMFENNSNFNFIGYKKDWENYLEEDSIMIFVSEINATLECFRESMGSANVPLSTPHELRCLFATLTINGFPTLTIYDNEEMMESLMKDWTHRPLNPLTYNQAINLFLKEIQKLLQIYWN